ncbi:MAG: hypothetical protein GY795_21520 [Desulfobacterales bacterium]|nr:hypothetical protein [Desulfobacterales bacterium]
MIFFISDLLTWQSQIFHAFCGDGINADIPFASPSSTLWSDTALATGAALPWVNIRRIESRPYKRGIRKG